MKERDIHYLDDQESLTTCGINIYIYKPHLVVTPQWENVTCWHCKQIKDR